jgi:copper transport protein
VDNPTVGNQPGSGNDCTGIMAAMTSPARIVRVTVTGVLAGLFLLLGLAPAPAAAHANLLDTNPANGTILNEMPAQVVLTFSEPVRLIPDRIVVIAPDGEPVDTGEITADGPVVTIPIEGGGARGTYLVSYRVISQDSHPVGNSITFSIGAPSEVPELTYSQAEGDPVVAAAVSVNRYLGYAGLVLLVGTVLMLVRMWPQRLSRRGMIRLAWTGFGLVTVSSLLGVGLQVPYSSGDPLSNVDLDGLQQVLSTPFGVAHVVRIGVLIALALVLRPVLSGRGARSDLLLVGLLGVAGLATWPFAGHPIAAPIPPLSILADGIHLTAMSIWLGGLVVLVGFLLRLANERELAAILPEWSRWATALVAALALTGVSMAVFEVQPLESLWQTTYGRLLLLKVGLVLLTLAVAAGSRSLVHRHLAPYRPRTARWLVGIEAVVLAGVIGLTSVLVQTTPARTAITGADQAIATDYAATLTSPIYSVQVLLEPGGVGSNTLHLYSYTLDGDPLPVEEWRATAALPAEGIEPIEIQLLPLTDTHVFGDVAMPVAGDWEFTFTLRISEFEQASVETTVSVR